MGMRQHVSEEMRRCAELCAACHAVCLETIGHCLHMGAKQSEPHQVRLLMDCAQICQTSADFMLRGSDLHGWTCRACEDVCQRCADDCVKMGDDQQMKSCVQACRRCAESCGTMAT